MKVQEDNQDCDDAGESVAAVAAAFCQARGRRRIDQKTMRGRISVVGLVSCCHIHNCATLHINAARHKKFLSDAGYEASLLGMDVIAQ
jgi:hypothetical protein